MSLPHPDEVRAALASAQNHATDEVLTLKRKQRKWILVGAGAYAITLVGLAVALVLLYQSNQRIVVLGQKQVESSKTGRGILLQVAALADQIKSFTDPNSQSSKDQQAKVASYLAALDEASREGRADQLKKIAQMFMQCTRLPCDPSIVNRILAQPVPVPTFGPTRPAATPAPPSPATMRSGVAPTPTPSICQGIQVAPLNVARVCIPP